VLDDAAVFAAVEVFGNDSLVRASLGPLLRHLSAAFGDDSYADTSPAPSGWRPGLQGAIAGLGRVLDAVEPGGSAELGACAALIRVSHEGLAYVAHVGDLRVYLYRQGELTQLTVDHTLASDDRYRRIPDEGWPRVSLDTLLTRTIGGNRRSEPDLRELVLQVEDLLLIAGRGVYGALDDSAIVESVERFDLEPLRVVEALIDWAAPDADSDMTALAVRVVSLP
jgi:serine/threonine protein phosphatase PrpC